MKDSDIGELYVEINIDPTIISDLERMQQRLILLTHNDEDVMSKIVEHSLLIEKTPDHYLRRHRKNEDDDEKGQLLTLVYELGLIITGKDERIHEPVKNLPDESRFFYKKLMRKKIEEKVIEIFYPDGVETNEPQTEMMVDQIQETSMIGDIETQFDNMDV